MNGLQVIPSAGGGQHLLVKTENGQMHLVRVAGNGAAAVSSGQAIPATSHVALNQVTQAPSPTIPNAQFRFQQSQVVHTSLYLCFFSPKIII